MKQSATTYVTIEAGEGGTENTLRAVYGSRNEAAQRLGGSDGLDIVSSTKFDDGRIGVTWRREWEAADPAPEPAPQQEEAAQE
ncbi:hypothetical protein JQ628_23555 [Bradyrhizobium lablabi]|uniref:hypothetical protein n=1 Tax=Bradyrhizobium lablabi TaxID=722472 RepID=UPI001BAE26E0|nr:hypothetical protein [Bradyrhizobium lablabi]MBR1124523.1 hypothetical protein [Bradyrhizobium lablabi]